MSLFLIVAVSQLGAWQVTQDVDPITDQPRIRAELIGDNAKLVLNCEDSGRTLAYDPVTYLGGGLRRSYQMRPLIFRIDDNSPVRVHWQYQRGYALAPSRRVAVRFLSSLLSGNRLTIRAERYDGATIDSTFDLTGAGEVLPAALQACGLNN